MLLTARAQEVLVPPKLKVVMFTDQVKSTINTVRRTNAEIEQVARQQDKLTAEVLHMTSGTFLNETGDGCLAEFPSVLEAVQAGVILQQRVADRNKAQTSKQMQFELHIGIDSGELVVLEDGKLRGNAANRCARICSQCPPGEVYLSETAAGMLKKNEVELESAGAFSLKGISGKTKLFRIAALHFMPKDARNPFIWRGGITNPEDFFNRDDEQSTLRAYLQGKQNCQIVGPRRIGKTSLLRQVERVARDWEETAVVAYLDLQDARCYSLSGWLNRASKQFRWDTSVTSLAEFADCVEDMLQKKNQRPVLCLDEFEELIARRNEFSSDFFKNLRSCGQQGMSIFTASQKQLSELTEPSDPTSPFYNTFPLLRLGQFGEADARDFVTIYRSGVPSFTKEERAMILEFAKGHPQALQVVCFHMLEAKKKGYNLITAMQRASEDVKANLPSGWGFSSS